MNYRKFGNTDLEVSEICFGPMRFAARARADDEQSRKGRRALERALEGGVNVIHSSFEYGTRWALGEVLKKHRKRHEIHHIIKVPVPDFEDGGKFDPAKFRHRVEEALRDLHAERIDVIQHLQRSRPNTDELRIPNLPAVQEGLREIFEKLREEGKAGYLTTFPYTPGFAAKALQGDEFSGMAAYYNVVEMEMTEFFPEMREKGRGFFCIRPFMGGLLTDTRIDRERLPRGDRFLEERWAPVYERLGKLKKIFSGEIESWTAFAIKFALIHPLVSSLIVSMNTPEQIDGVLTAADGNYPDQTVFERVRECFLDPSGSGN